MCKVFVGLPTMHSIDTKVRFEHDKLITSTNGEFEIRVEAFENFDRDDARNKISVMADEEGYDYIMMFDDDMILPENCFNLLYSGLINIDTNTSVLELKRPSIIGGLYCSFGKDYKQHCYEWDASDKGFLNVPIEPNTGIHRRDMIGAGCMLMHTRVLDQLEYPYYQFAYINNRKFGEDNYFFMKCYEAKIPVYIHSDVVCTHIGKFGVKPNKEKTVEIVNLV